MGIDEAIFRLDIPTEDPLQLRKLKSHYDDTNITIDYKSNNLKDDNSIYIKLKPYYHPNKYFIHTKKGKKIDPIEENLCKKIKQDPISTTKSLAGKTDQI